MSLAEELYQELIVDHSKKPRNCHDLKEPDCHAEGDNPLCGDHVNVYATVKDGIVTDVSFTGSGCAISTASASIMTEAIKGKTIEQAKDIFRRFHALVTGRGKETVNGEGLGKLEVFSGVCKYPARVKCATLAWHTLDAALEGNDAGISTE